jgi:hypothetical protein
MPQEICRGRKDGRISPMRASVARAAAGFAVLGLVFLNAAVARADADNPMWDKFMQSLGLKSQPDAQIHYSERSPLVVPPTRDLPPPTPDAVPAPNWPTDTKNTPSKQAKKDAVVPGTGPIQTPNPVVVKHWYNPSDWFNKEEYGTFPGEPVRADLTDPPQGYRTPSPTQPYGISPEGKPAQAKVSDFGYVPVTQGSQGSSQPDGSK